MSLSSDVASSPHKLEPNSPEIVIWNGSGIPEPRKEIDLIANKRFSVVFDLDNTLLYTTPLRTENTSFIIYQKKSISSKARSDTSLMKAMAIKKISETKVGSIENHKKIACPKIIKRKFFVQIRPKLHEFLRSVIQKYNIYFYTASEKEYAKEVVSKILEDVFDSNLDELENYKSNLDRIIFSREYCTFMNGYELKDLRILDKPLSDIILVDDIQGSGLLQPMNSLIIPPFYGDTNDDFLVGELLPLLNKCSDEYDLIPSIRKYAIDLSPHLVLYPELYNSDY